MKVGREETLDITTTLEILEEQEEEEDDDERKEVGGWKHGWVIEGRGKVIREGSFHITPTEETLEKQGN